MSSVTVRKRDLKDGRKSLYLDIYHEGKCKHKSLGLVLEKGTSREVKEHNQQTALIADKVRKQVLQQIMSGEFGKENIKRSYSWAEFFAILVKERYNIGTNYSCWRSVYKHLKSFLKDSPDLPLSDVTPTVLEHFKNHMLSNPKLKQNSVAGYFDVMKHCLHEAYRRKIIKENPADNIKSVKYINPHREFLTIEEIQKLAQTSCYYPEIKRAFLFSVFTGLRCSDMRQLKWSQVQSSNEMGAFIRFTQRKTKDSQTIPLSSTAQELLGVKKDENEELVFPNLKFGVWQNLKLKQWGLDAGIIGKRLNMHMGRHSHACLLLSKGVDIYTVSKLLGHKDLKTTQIYAKIVDKNKQAASALLPEIEIREI